MGILHSWRVFPMLMDFQALQRLFTVLVARAPVPPWRQYVLHALPTLTGPVCRVVAHVMLVILGLSISQPQRHITLGRVLQSRVLPTLQGWMYHLAARAMLDAAGVLQQQQAICITHQHALQSRVLPPLLELMCQVVAHAMLGTVGVLQH